MPGWRLNAVALGTAAIIGLPALSGCALGGTQVDALEIVVWQDEERDRLEAGGFVQRSGE